MPYDVIVVGARCAGSPLAMLLARSGMQVLLVDRDSFPSDIMSTHYVHPPGVGALARWGVLDRLLATDLPRLTYARQVMGGQETKNPLGPDAGVFGLAPRRVTIDKILVDAAVEAGAELRQDTLVEGLLRDESGTVTGVTGRGPGGAPFRETARLVVGADGLHSRIARLVQPAEYNHVASVMCGYYSYFTGTGLPRDGLSFYMAPGAGCLLFPTHDDAICVAGARGIADFDTYRKDVEGTFFSTMDRVGIGDQVRAGQMKERIKGSGDLPHFFRRPHGPGWALVGDAGLHLDPTMGLGMTKAFAEAEMLAPAIVDALSGARPIAEAMSAFHRDRDEAWLPQAQANLNLSCMLSGMTPPTLEPWSEPQVEAASAAT